MFKILKAYKIPCKVNLFLRILSKRADGYHELESLFVAISSPCDELIIRKTNKPGLVFKCDASGIDLDNNTITKVFSLFEAQSTENFCLEVELIKGIKQGAGLGGGSADAAYFLRFLNELSEHKLSDSQMQSLALQVGADLVFFLQDEPAIVSGIGEKIQVANLKDYGLKGLILLVISPEIQVNTKEAYKKFDFFQEKILTDSRQIGKRQFLQAQFENSFEETIFAEYPLLAQYKERLIQLGASFAVLSGSGSSIVGVFRSEDLAQKAKNKFQKENVYINYL